MEKEAETAACPWQTLTLQFWDPDLEVEFTKHQFDSLTLHLNSRYLFARSFVFASISGGLMRKDRSLLFYQLTAAMNGIIYAAMAVGSCCRCKWLMATWSWLIFCTRVLGMVSCAWMIVVGNQPEDSIVSMLGRILASSIIGGLSCYPLCRNLQFWQNCIANSIAALIGSSSTSIAYCHIWLENGTFQPVIQQAASDLAEWISWASFFPLRSAWQTPTVTEEPTIGTDSCWLVITFLQVTSLAILPTAIIYCMESHSRMTFLLSRHQDQKSQQIFRDMWHRTVIFALWCSAVCLIALWVVLVGLADLNQILQGHSVGSECSTK